MNLEITCFWVYNLCMKGIKAHDDIDKTTILWHTITKS